jgi:hypothetical protein
VAHTSPGPGSSYYSYSGDVWACVGEGTLPDLKPLTQLRKSPNLPSVLPVKGSLSDDTGSTEGRKRVSTGATHCSN